MVLNGLTESTLAEVCTLVTDGTHDTPKRVTSGFPLIKAKEITGGRIDFESCDQISEEEHIEVIARSKPEFGDTLFAHIGASLGEAAFVNTTREFSIKNIALFKPNPAIINARYLYYLVISPAFQSLAKGTKTGSAQPFLGLSQLRSHRIEYHRDLATQRSIGAILSAYDDLMENGQKRIKILEAMARTLYREWFIRENFPSNKRDNSFRKSTFGDLFVLVKEPFAEKLHNDRPLLDLSRMPQHSLAPELTGKASELTTSRILFEPGDTLFGAIRCYLHKVVAVHFRGVTNTSVLVLRPKKECFRSLAAIIASDKETIRWADTHSTGTKMPVINWGVFQTMPAPLPSDVLAERFESIAGPMLEQIGILSTQIQNLRHTRDLLLPRLLSGQVN